MNTTLNKLLKILALGIVFYFLCDAISAIDTSPSQQHILTFEKKTAIDKSNDIEEVRYIAKSYLDDLLLQHENRSAAGIINMNLLIVLMCILIYLSYSTKKTDTV